MPLGRPAFAVLQLFYSPDAAPADAELQPLCGIRSPRGARASVRGSRPSVEQELGPDRSLFEVVSEAISRLSLDHTLETAVERTSELLQVDAIGIYLHDKERLLAAAGRGVAGGHEEVARVVLGRTGEPAELAATAVWLASALGGYMVGQSIAVDCGLTIN